MNKQARNIAKKANWGIIVEINELPCTKGDKSHLSQHKTRHLTFESKNREKLTPLALLTWDASFFNGLTKRWSPIDY